MILIADSGSSKCDWALLNGEIVSEFRTIGFNPLFHTSAFIHDTLRNEADLVKLGKSVSQVFFYGAGCTQDEMKNIVRKGLEHIFANAEIFVENDLVACAYATYDGSPSISCILGTGSNSCFFDGIQIHQFAPALGYILGDEGSGTYFGKRILRDLLYNRIPEPILSRIKEDQELGKDNVIEHVYRKENVNVFLASISKYMLPNRNEPYISELLNQGFKEFLQFHVASFENYSSYETNFVGSLAFLYREELELACREMGVKCGQIIQRPINGLVNFHRKN